MKYPPYIWLIGALSVFAGCSGSYRVGSDAGNAGTSNGGGASSFADSGVSGAGVSGAGVAGAGVSGADAASGAAGSVYSAAGAAGRVLEGGDPGPGSFCGQPLPTAHDVRFAPSSVVYQRVFEFLFADDQPPAMTLPTETTRQWAGALAAAALASLSTPSTKGMDRFVESWWPGTPTPELWAAYFSSNQGTLNDLLTSNRLLENGAGMLTDPAVLSHAGISARGNLVNRQLLCLEVPLDPDSGILPTLMPGQTRREQHDQLVSGPPCKTCHGLIDPFGYALGNFATDGSYRTMENDLPIDTQATLPLPQAGMLTVLDAHSLGDTLANSCEVALCLTRTLLHDAAVSANLPNQAGEQEIAQIAAQFTATGRRLPELVRLVVESDAFLSAD